MHFVPDDTIGILDLLQSMVASRHGKQAIAPAEVWNDDKGEIFVTRAGGITSYREDVAHWEAARREIHDALRTRELIAMVLSQQGRIIVPLIYWDMFVAERSLWDGKLQKGGQGTEGLVGLSIFMDGILARDWMRSGKEEHSNTCVETHPHTAARRLTKAETEAEYKKRVNNWPRTEKNPSRDEDEKWGRGLGISRMRMRELRENFALPEWTTTGPRTGSK